MVLKSDQERVKTLLSETITLLCRNGLHFQSELSVEALIGITLDRDEVFLVSIKELIKSNSSLSNSSCGDDFLVSQKPEGTDAAAVETDVTGLAFGCSESKSAVGETSNACSSQNRSSRVTESHQDRSKADESCSVGNPRIKRRKTLDTSLEYHSSDNSAVFKQSSFNSSQNETDIEMCNDASKGSTGNVVNEEKSAVNCLPPEPQDSLQRRNELAAASDVFGKGFSAEAVHIKEETFSNSDMSYYNPTTSFLPYPSTFTRTVADADHFGNVCHTFPAIEQPPSCSGVDMQSSGSNLSQSVDNFIVGRSQGSSVNGQNLRAAGAVSGVPHRSYRCQMCGTTIGDLNGYKEHVKRHRNIYKYYCNICGKGFSASINLRGHLVKHTGVKEFCCTLCPKDFAYKRQLERHMASSHPTREMHSLPALTYIDS